MKAFVIAMADEAEAVRAAVSGEVKLWRSGEAPLHHSTAPQFHLFISGIGKVNAAAATQRAIDLGATEILNAGLAGGFPRTKEVQGLRSKVQGALDFGRWTLDSVTIGGVYEVASAVEYDFDLAKLNGTAVGVLDERTTPFIPMATTGKFPAKILATGDHFNDKEDDYRLITDELGAELRDMEGAAIAHVCEKAGVTCRALKCVTNVAGGGSMVGQFEENRKRCLAILTEAIKHWV